MMVAYLVLAYITGQLVGGLVILLCWWHSDKLLFKALHNQEH